MDLFQDMVQEHVTKRHHVKVLTDRTTSMEDGLETIGWVLKSMWPKAGGAADSSLRLRFPFAASTSSVASDRDAFPLIANTDPLEALAFPMPTSQSDVGTGLTEGVAPSQPGVFAANEDAASALLVQAPPLSPTVGHLSPKPNDGEALGQGTTPVGPPPSPPLAPATPTSPLHSPHSSPRHHDLINRFALQSSAPALYPAISPSILAQLSSGLPNGPPGMWALQDYGEESEEEAIGG